MAHWIVRGKPTPAMAGRLLAKLRGTNSFG